MAVLNGYRDKFGDEEWIMNDIKTIQEGNKVPMGRGQLALVAGCYVGLTVLLFSLMYKTSHIPGADIALLLLKD